MKKILNILGYISLLSIPVLVITFILMFYTEVKVMNIIAFTIITIAQIIHYKKTKIKYIGIRILITLVITIICSVIIYNGYGIFKGFQIKGDLDNNLDFVSEEKNNENTRNHWFFYDYSEKDIQNMNKNNEDFEIEYNEDENRVISINRNI